MTSAFIGSLLAGEGVAKGVGGRLEGENWKTGEVRGEFWSVWFRLGWRILGRGLGWSLPRKFLGLIPGDLRLRPFHLGFDS